MTDMILIYITCASPQEARKIGRHLLKKRLCGCVNIFADIDPIYWWPPKAGKLEEGKETVLLVKTIEKKYKEVETEVLKVHSFDTPAIIAIPTVHVLKKYYDWIKGEVR